jgi:hypothetical protein
MIRLILFLPLLFILLESCIDPLKIELLHGTQKLVVDGLITNDPGPYEVRLSYTTSLDNALKKSPLATGASVFIFDNMGQSERLSEVGPGVYRSKVGGIRGVIGRSYYVRIKTFAGREYQSQPQQLAAAGEITGISFQFQPLGLKGNNPNQYIDAVRILVDAEGVEKEKNLLRWRWKTIFLARTYPELATDWKGSLKPEPCSGMVVGTGPMGLTKVGECTCCICWPYNYSRTGLISHNRIIDGLEFKKVGLGTIPAGTQQFYDKYYLNVEQLSISEDVYDFWNLVEKQESANGNLFQPNSVKVRGNVNSLNDPDEEVLGIFGVSGITRKEMYIPRDVVPHKLPPLDSIKHACADSFQLVTTEKPPFW